MVSAISHKSSVFFHAADNIRFVAVAGIQVSFFFFQAEDGIRDVAVTGVQTCALPIFRRARLALAVFVVALLALAQVQRPHASTNIVWRFLVVSFDSPSTQALDALATRSEERRVGKECRSRWSAYH